MKIPKAGPGFALCVVSCPRAATSWSPPIQQRRPTLQLLRMEKVASSGEETNEYEICNPDLPRRDVLDLMKAASAAFLASTVKPFPSKAMTTDPKTGITLPDEGEIEASVPLDWDAVENPLLGEDSNTKSLLGRLDSVPDSVFYMEPRFVEHVDDNAVQLMSQYISNGALKKGDAVLDLCSSWTSHIEANKVNDLMLTRVAGLGMNAKELSSNPSLTDYDVKDLNQDPRLPYDDSSFDVVLCQLSIDYLTKPLEVLKEVGRVLKPMGRVQILFSNRLFLSKAVAIWTGADDIDHAYTVGCYLHFCKGGFENIAAEDLSTRKGRDRRIFGDPLYVVTAQKKATG